MTVRIRPYAEYKYLFASEWIVVTPGLDLDRKLHRIVEYDRGLKFKNEQGFQKVQDHFW